MIQFLKNLFKKRIWKEKSRLFLRTEYPLGLRSDYYLIKYEDLLSGETKEKVQEINFGQFP